jgi:hypothetical protein
MSYAAPSLNHKLYYTTVMSNKYQNLLIHLQVHYNCLQGQFAHISWKEFEEKLNI